MTVKTAAVAYEVRWRKNSDAADHWSTPVDVGADGHVSVPGLERVTDYTFEARAVSACGAKSAWATQTFNLPDVQVGTITLAELSTETAAAQQAADAANTQLAAIANDNILSPAEKPTVIRDNDVITSEQAGIDAQATAYGITTQKTDYDNAVSALTSYLATLTTPTMWNDKSGNTTIVGATFIANFNAVYTTRQTLLNAIYAAAQGLANNAQGTANNALTNANTALTNAQNAQTSANTANAQLAAIASDNLLSPSEKPIPIRDYSVILTEHAGIDAQADAYGVSRTAYDTAVSALSAYLAGLTSPAAWNDVSGNTTIDGPTFRGKFADVYSARQALLNAIYAAAKVLANNANTLAGQQSSGRNHVFNPSFVSNVGAYPNYGTVQYGYVRDGWQLLSIASPLISPLYDANALGIGFIFGQGIGISAGATVAAVWYSNLFSVEPNKPYVLLVTHSTYLAQALQAGLVAVNSIGIDWYDAVQHYLSTTFIETDGGYPQRTDGFNGNVPANAYGCRLQLFGGVRNTTGAAVTTAYANTAEPIWNNVQFYTAADLDSDVVDGTNYGRLANLDLYSSGGFNRLGLRIAGSGHTIGDQRNLLPVTWAGVRSIMSNTPVSYSISGTTVNFTVAATTFSGGGITVPYNASSGSVTQTAGTTVTYSLYYRDPNTAGGSQTLYITSNATDLAAHPDVVYLGYATVTVASGGGGTGGSGSGGGGSGSGNNPPGYPIK